MSDATFYEQLLALEQKGTAFVFVVLAESLGSTPQDSGAKMLVTAAGLYTGTVGGGKVEARAIELASAMLQAAAAETRFVNWTLKADVGMTCGGSVKLYFEPHLAGGAGAAWPIWIFGAGHVVQALVPVLAPLDCQLTICDPRSDWLDRLPRARNIRYRYAEQPADLVGEIPDNAFLLCLTKGHSSDRPVLHRALAERNFPYIGAIGSDAKAAILRRELIAAGLTPELAKNFHCPIGLPFGTNQTHEIALSIAAQLLTERDILEIVRQPNKQTMVITSELANRLENTEALHLTRQVQICAQLRPKLGAHVVPAAGGIAAFTAGEYGRKLNHVTGFGLGVSVAEHDLIASESAYAKMGLSTEIDVCPFVNDDVLEFLATRNYAVNAFSNTYVTALSGIGPKSFANSGIKIDQINPADGADFLAASTAGFAKQRPDRPTALIETLARIAIARKDSRLYVARIDGQIAGTAGLALIDLPDGPVAYLYIASTLPAYRGRGVQHALIHARLADARRAGFEIASITARPNSASSRNASRAGFALAYTKATFASRFAGSATAK